MRLALRLIGAAILVAAVTWLATAIDWPLVMAWLHGIWDTLASSVSDTYETLVSLGLIPDAVHPENAVIPLPMPPR